MITLCNRKIITMIIITLLHKYNKLAWRSGSVKDCYTTARSSTSFERDSKLSRCRWDVKYNQPKKCYRLCCYMITQDKIKNIEYGQSMNEAELIYTRDIRMKNHTCAKVSTVW